MKKYILFLSIFAFGLFISNVSLVGATGSSNDYLPGCTTASQLYSTTTGKPCGTAVNVECAVGDLYSSLTGRPCKANLSSDNSSTEDQASSLLDVLFNRELGLGSKGEDVKALQQLLKDVGVLAGKIDGSYGPITQKALLEYQKNNGIPQTGKVDEATIATIKDIQLSKLCSLVSSVKGNEIIDYVCQANLNVNVASTTSVTYDGFTTCLKDKGAVFYGAFWCPHCQAQKALFGSSKELLPYVECSTTDGASQTQACINKNITTYPTWEFSDGSRMTGELTLKQLSDKTSCTLPQ